MPELPEMETLRRNLAERIVGRTITAIDAERPRRLNRPPEALNDWLAGFPVERIERRGKSLAIHLGSSPPAALYVHLMLGGRVSVHPSPAAGPVSVALGAVSVVFHVGLGRVEALDPAALAAKWQKLGVEPLDPGFSPSVWQRRYHLSTRPIKACLMDQHAVAGIGNVYSDEILYAARIHPAAPAQSLDDAAWERIGGATVAILAEAVAHGGVGPPIDDQDTLSGGYRPHLSVHYRQNAACGAKGRVVKGIVAGRTCYWCEPDQAPAELGEFKAPGARFRSGD